MSANRLHDRLSLESRCTSITEENEVDAVVGWPIDNEGLNLKRGWRDMLSRLDSVGPMSCEAPRPLMLTELCYSDSRGRTKQK
jgi:hypothetical protein